MSARLPQFYTTAEVGRLLGVAARTVRRWIARGDLSVHRLGRSVRIAEPDLRAFLASRRRL